MSPGRAGMLVLAACALTLAALPACPSGPRDVLVGGRHVQTQDASVATTAEGYAYVARRPLVAVGLASAQGLTPDEAHDAVDNLADRISRCASNLLGQGKLVDGGAHLVLPVDDAGVVGRPNVVFSPSDATTSGLLCVLSPARMINFPPAGAKGGKRELVVETAWGRQVSPVGAP